MAAPRLAIVVPTLNEEATIARALAAALPLADELVVCDGGSSDRSAEIAAACGARLVVAPPGRGTQLAGGAAATDADLLLFLHADTTLPADAPRLVRDAVEGGAVGGGFTVRFDSARPVLRLAARLINARTRLLRLPLGDQAQFASRAAFARAGGFRPWPILEDLDFIRRLRRQGRIAVLSPPVTTAARRFTQRGVARTVATNWLIWGLFLCGMSPPRLARLYGHVR